MVTIRLKNTNEDIQKAAKIILNGGVVAIPTDTLYGLASLDDQKVASIKGRSLTDKPISWLVNKMVFPKFTKDNSVLVEKYWPGALTIIQDQIGYRESDDPISNKLINIVNKPITGTSANKTGESASTKYKEVLIQLDGLIDAIVIDDSIPNGKESTVVQDGKVIRQGAIFLS